MKHKNLGSNFDDFLKEEDIEIFKEVEPLIPHDHFKCSKCGRILPKDKSKCNMTTFGVEILCVECYDSKYVEVP